MRSAPSRRATQTERLRRFFEARAGQWVGLPDILALGMAQYNARIYEIRLDEEREGFKLENRFEDAPDGTRHSWYRFQWLRAKQTELFGRGAAA